jgi:FAD/FMN-containing dehydrogenase
MSVSVAVDALSAIVGGARVSRDPEEVETYASDSSFAAPMNPAAIVKVQNAGEVESLVKWANRTHTPLVPVSSGSPHLRGDTVPEMPHSVIVDLSGMKRILSVNRLHRMVVVEPGVTYGELQAFLAGAGLTLSVPLATKATKSVLASALELEPRLNALHQWAYTEPLRCVEVTWGDGNRMFTGEAGGAPPDLETQQGMEKWQVSATGPNMLDFYRLLTGAQGTMGIVTWASLRCDVLPQSERTFLVPASGLDDLIEFVRRVLYHRFSDGLFMMNGAALACLLGESSDEVRALCRRLPRWVAVVNVVGRELLPRERVEAQSLDIADIAGSYGLKLLPWVDGAGGEEVRSKAFQPSRVPYWKETLHGAFQEIFFATTLDRTPDFVATMQKQAETAGYPVEDLGVYIQPVNMGTSCHCEFLLPYGAGDSVETARVKRLFREASEALLSAGAYFSRPYGDWAPLQLNRDAQSATILRKLKGIFDPNGILNPGKLSA